MTHEQTEMLKTYTAMLRDSKAVGGNSPIAEAWREKNRRIAEAIEAAVATMEKYRDELVALGSAASASLSSPADDEDWEPHPDHQKLADYVMEKVLDSGAMDDALAAKEAKP